MAPHTNESARLLAQILADRPQLHRGELELSRPLNPAESLLADAAAQKIAEALPVCYGIHEEVAEFLFNLVQPTWKTLEVGLGISTLVISLKGATHICITPHEREHGLIRDYAARLGISLLGTTFVAESSDTYLPRCEHRELDFVFIDGKHAFPFPIIDWYYTADRLKRGALIGIDDAQMKPVQILKDFMDADPRWEEVHAVYEKTYFYRKLVDSVHDVAWHMQPYVFHGMKGRPLRQPRSLTSRIRSRLRRLFDPR